MKIYPTRIYTFTTNLSKHDIYERLWNNQRSKFDMTLVFFNKTAALELGQQNLRDSLSLDSFPARSTSPVQIYKGKLSLNDGITTIEIKSFMGIRQRLFVLFYSLFTGLLCILAVGSLILSPDWTMREFPVFVLFIPFVMFIFCHVFIRFQFSRQTDFAIEYYKHLFEAISG